MPRQENIVNTFWEDIDHLSDDAVFLYFWSWTNGKCGMSGLYRVAKRKLLEGRQQGERVEAALSELEADGKLFYEDGVLWCVARVKRRKGLTSQIAKSIIGDLENIGESHPLVERFLEKYGAYPILASELEGHPTLTRPSPDPQRNGLDKGNGRPSPEGHPTLTRGSIPKPKSKPVPKPVENNQPPSGFPEAQVPIAEQCVDVLQRVAVAKEAKPVTLLAVCRAIESYPNRGYVKVAGDLEHWCLHGNGAAKPAKDVVARWRNFLDGSPEIAQPSSNGNGKPAAATRPEWQAYDDAIENR